MDPNKALAEIRELTKLWSHQLDDHQVQRLLELVAGLDDWMSKGGFMPEPWMRARP